MREVSTVLESILSASDIKIFTLVNFRDTSYFTSLPYDIVMSDGRTYVSDGGLVSIEPPRLTDVVDRELYRITFNDSSFNLKPYLEQGIIGSNLEVRIGFFNLTGSTLFYDNGALVIPNDQPISSITDTLLGYKGIISGYNYNIDLNDNSSTVIIEASSPMNDLDFAPGIYTSSDTMDRFDPGDTSFDKVYDGSSQIVFKWGRI